MTFIGHYEAANPMDVPFTITLAGGS
jgi:hypothetical protein